MKVIKLYIEKLENYILDFRGELKLDRFDSFISAVDGQRLTYKRPTA